MKHLEAQYKNDELGEKHIPQILKENGKKIVKLEKHPMINEHFIQFVEVYSKDRNEIRLKYFYPEQKVEYDITDFEEAESVELCNIHELWRNKEEE